MRLADCVLFAYVHSRKCPRYSIPITSRQGYYNCGITVPCNDFYQFYRLPFLDFSFFTLLSVSRVVSSYSRSSIVASLVLSAHEAP